MEYDDIKKEFSTIRFNYIQGCCYHNGRIYSSEGFTGGETNVPAIRIVNLEKGIVETTINLPSKLRLDVEPEFLSVYRERLYYMDALGNLYYFEKN